MSVWYLFGVMIFVFLYKNGMWIRVWCSVFGYEDGEWEDEELEEMVSMIVVKVLEKVIDLKI